MEETMGRIAKRQVVAANQLGLRAARRMALQSATVPADQVDASYSRETEFLGMTVSVAADDLALASDRSRGRFEATVLEAFNCETDRILALIAKGTRSLH
jgi:hypothetical protein